MCHLTRTVFEISYIPDKVYINLLQMRHDIMGLETAGGNLLLSYRNVAALLWSEMKSYNVGKHSDLSAISLKILQFDIISILQRLGYIYTF